MLTTEKKLSFIKSLEKLSRGIVVGVRGNYYVFMLVIVVVLMKEPCNVKLSRHKVKLIKEQS